MLYDCIMAAAGGSLERCTSTWTRVACLGCRGMNIGTMGEQLLHHSIMATFRSRLKCSAPIRRGCRSVNISSMKKQKLYDCTISFPSSKLKGCKPILESRGCVNVGSV